MTQTNAHLNTAAPRIPAPAAMDARSALGLAMLQSHVPNDVLTAIQNGDPVGVVLVVPSDAHVEILKEALDGIVDQSDFVVEMPPTPDLATARHLVEGLSLGCITIAICTGLDEVPATFKALADHIIHMGTHDAKMLRKVMRQVLDGPIPQFPRGFVPHSSPDLICRCIEPRLSPRRVSRALVRLGDLARTTTDDVEVPELETAIEFGAARSWGLQVKKDVAAWQARTLPASDLDTACLISGPPGTGKTLFARVLAKSMRIPLFELTIGSALAGDGHLGNVIAALRNRFAEAMEAAPSILLLDEIDSVLSRGADSYNKSFVTGLVNEVLSLLDGASTRRPGLIVIGTTNRPDDIDPALLRPGRLGTHLVLNNPDSRGIESILRFHLKNDLRGEHIDEVVRLAAGSSAARLMEMVKAARRTARNAARRMTVRDLLGPLLRSDDEDMEALPQIALHEAGHAIAALILPDGPILRSVSLTPVGSSRGNVLTSDPPGVMTRSRCEARIMMTLAGRAAEILIYGDDYSEGAGQDLHQATRLMAEIHGQGMGAELLCHADVDQLLMSDKDFAALVEAELQRLMEDTKTILAGHLNALVALAAELLERRFMTGQEAHEVLRSCGSLEDPIGDLEWEEFLASFA